MANYTIKAIMENFEAMLVEMPFNKVTVSALVERCGISSNTFYYHFRDIYALLDAWLTAKEDKYLADADEDFVDWPEFLSEVLKTMQENSRLVYHIADAIPKDRLENYVFGKVQERFYTVAKRRINGADVSDEFIESIGEFYCCTVLGFVQKFLWNHMESDVDEAVERLRNTFSGITAYMVAEEMNRKHAEKIK